MRCTIETEGFGTMVFTLYPELKALADAVCGPVDRDGVYWYCAENGLI